MSGLGGVLAAAMALPVVAATGILVRNTADKFTTLSIDASSLAAAVGDLRPPTAT